MLVNNKSPDQDQEQKLENNLNVVQTVKLLLIELWDIDVAMYKNQGKD